MKRITAILFFLICVIPAFADEQLAWLPHGTSTVTYPGCPQGVLFNMYSGYNDGCASAPIANALTFQNQNFLTTAPQSGQLAAAGLSAYLITPHNPISGYPWNIAGVDYPVGPKTLPNCSTYTCTAIGLKQPSVANFTIDGIYASAGGHTEDGCFVNGNHVDCNGPAAPTSITIDGYDFTGYYLKLGAAFGLNSSYVLVQNSFLSYSSAIAGTAYLAIASANLGSVTFQYDIFDMMGSALTQSDGAAEGAIGFTGTQFNTPNTDCGSPGGQTPSICIQYSAFFNSPSRFVTNSIPNSGSNTNGIILQYNYAEGMQYPTSEFDGWVDDGNSSSYDSVAGNCLTVTSTSPSITVSGGSLGTRFTKQTETITWASPNYTFGIGLPVTVAGATPSNWNTTTGVVLVATPTSVTFYNASATGSWSSGGTATITGGAITGGGTPTLNGGIIWTSISALYNAGLFWYPSAPVAPCGSNTPANATSYSLTNGAGYPSVAVAPTSNGAMVQGGSNHGDAVLNQGAASGGATMPTYSTSFNTFWQPNSSIATTSFTGWESGSTTVANWQVDHNVFISNTNQWFPSPNISSITEGDSSITMTVSSVIDNYYDPYAASLCIYHLTHSGSGTPTISGNGNMLGNGSGSQDPNQNTSSCYK